MNYFCGMLTNKRRVVLFPVGTIAKDSHRDKSPPTCCTQDLNLRIQALLKEIVQ